MSITFDAVQASVASWVVTTLGPDVARNGRERALRLAEEVAELCQAVGLGKDQLHALVEYVYSRPVGVVAQEVGGVVVTLAALTEALGLNLAECANRELRRIHEPEVVERVRRRQAEKREAGMTLDDFERGRRLTEVGHLAHCIRRMVWGDGECECGIGGSKT